MKILVLGATGLLGSQLVHFLKKRECNAFAHGFSKESEYNADLTDLGLCFDLIDITNPDVIVNTVALTNVDECENNPLNAYKLNTKVVENISECIGNNNEISFIHISTDMVYDGIGENSEIEAKPQNYYALTKYCAEKEVILCGGTVLRTNFFGKFSKVKNKISYSDWILTSVKERKDIKFISDVYFSPLHLKTLVKMIYEVIKKPIPGIYNLGSNAGFSKSEFARKVCEIFKLNSEYVENIEVEDLGLQAYRPKQMRMDVRKFEKTYEVTLPTLSGEIQKLKKEIG